MATIINAADLPAYIGREVGVSDWIEIQQDRIDAFADVTGDHQFIHVDPERAAETPFGTTIAHGFLTVSLLVPMGIQAAVKLENAVMGVNYGFDKLRFINPVKVGSRIRGRFVLMSAEKKKSGHFLLKHQVSVEIEGEVKPALMAEWLGMTVIDESSLAVP